MRNCVWGWLGDERELSWASIVAFFCSDCCIRATSFTVGSTVFGGKPCAGGVVGAEDVDIDEAWEVTVWGFVLLVWTEIVFVISWSEWTRVHAGSDDNGV